MQYLRLILALCWVQTDWKSVIRMGDKPNTNGYHKFSNTGCTYNLLQLQKETGLYKWQAFIYSLPCFIYLPYLLSPCFLISSRCCWCTLKLSSMLAWCLDTLNYNVHFHYANFTSQLKLTTLLLIHFLFPVAFIFFFDPSKGALSITLGTVNVCTKFYGNPIVQLDLESYKLTTGAC